MADPSALAAAAHRVAEFAAAAAAAAAPPADDAARTRATAARALVVRDWAAVGALLGDPDPADPLLAVALSAGAAAARTPPPPAGWVGRAARRVLGSVETPAATPAPDVLDRAAARLAAGGLGAELAALVGGWKADPAVAGLVTLQRRLDAATDPPDDVLGRVARGEPDGPVAGGSVGLTAAARAAAHLAGRVVADLALHTANADAWNAARDWVAESLAAAGAGGELVFGPGPPPAGACEERFDLARTPGKAVAVRVRPGPPRPRSARDVWAELPLPPGWPGAAPPDWLVAWHASADPTTPKARFREWVTGDPVGQTWFDRCLAAAAADPHGDAGQWWRQLRAADWCRAYPDLDPDAAGPAWPPGGPPDWPTASSAPSDRPVGEVAEVRTYAATSADARVVLSDGPPSPDGPAARFHELVAAVGEDAGWWGDGRWAEARALSLDPPVDPDRPAALVAQWLAGVAADGPALDTLARWADGFGLTVVRPADAATGPRPGLTVRGVFAPEPAGTVVGRAGYGLTAGDRVFREAAADVSLGPAPAGFEALETFAAALPAADPFRVRVKEFRDALRGGYLLESAVQLYVDHWAGPGAGAAAAALTTFLTAAFGLVPFAPASVRDHPDGWVAVVPGSRTQSGRVRRVFRPGLKDEHGNLRIPALVEVD